MEGDRNKMRLDKKPIKTFYYKDWIIEYRPTLGWCYLKEGDKMCTVVYLGPDKKKDIIKEIEKEIKKREDIK
jgi:hypothetical protein